MGAEFVRRVYPLRQDGLARSRKAVLVCIAFHLNHETGQCSLKFATIAAELGVSVSGVEKAVKWLVAAGYIAAERNRRADGTLAAYVFTLSIDGDTV